MRGYEHEMDAPTWFYRSSIERVVYVGHLKRSIMIPPLRVRRVLSARGCKKTHTRRDLFYGLWIPDLFMERVEQDGEWSLMCPAQCPGLSECWGKEFEELYTRYEKVRGENGKCPPRRTKIVFYLHKPAEVWGV